MSDHTPVLFNVFEDWNEESVVPHVSFDSIRIWFEGKRPIRRSLVLSSIYGQFDLKFDSFRIVTPDSIRDSIRTQTAGSQVPSLGSSLLQTSTFAIWS